MAGDVGTILIARVLDRTGKGLRDAPRDALIADHLPSRARGSGFGMRISLFTIGSCLGSLLAAAITWASHQDFRLVFWIAVVPALLSVVVLVAWMDEPPNHHEQIGHRLARFRIAHLPAAFWWVVGIGGLIALARFSQAFLLLKAKDSGVAMAMVPIYLALMGLVYGATAYPFGILADRIDRGLQLGIGIATLVACHLVLASGSAVSVLVVGTVLWGLQRGIIDGLLATSVADVAPDELCGTAFGDYHLVFGVASSAGAAGEQAREHRISAAHHKTRLGNSRSLVRHQGSRCRARLNLCLGAICCDQI